MAYTSSQSFSPRGCILNYSTATSIGFAPVAELQQMDFSGQKLDLADVTNYQGGIFKEWLATLLDSGDLTFKGNFIPSDASQAAVLAAFNTATRVSWQLILPINAATGVTWGHFTFLGFVASFEIQLPIDKQAMISGKVKITGAITFVAGS
jgi:predicted secreted protein